MLDADHAEVARRLRAEEPSVAAEVRRLLGIDQRADDLDPDAIGLSLALSLGAATAVAREITAPPGFELHELLGCGSMGVVYRATQQVPRRQVAVKFTDGDGVAEAQALADADLPLIPSVWQVGEHRGRAFVAMELVRGQGLLEWAGGATLDARLALLEALCRGVHGIHQRGVLHRDLKPSNVLVDGSGPRLVDFGLATGTQSADRAVVGTVRYLAPEVLSGAPASVSSDVFSLTCIVYEVIAGRPALPGGSTPRRGEQARTTWERAPLAADLESVVRCGLGPEATRYPTAEALADELLRVRRGQYPLAMQASAWARVRRQLTRHRRVVVTSILAAVLALGVVGVRHHREAARESRAQQSLDRLTLSLPQQPDDAVAALDRFLTLPQIRDTRAEHLARLERATLRERQGQHDAARQDLAHVYAEGDADLRGRAATTLSTSFVAEQDWAALDAVVSSVPDPLQDELALLAAIGLREWHRPSVRSLPLFTALGQATATPVRARDLAQTSYQGSPALLAFQPRSPVQVVTIGSNGAFELGPSLDLPDAWSQRRPLVVDLQGMTLLGVLEDRRWIQLSRPGPEGLEIVATRQLPGELWSAVAGDPDGDGTPTLFLGTAPIAKSLRALSPPHWVPEPVARDLEAVDADVEQLLLADLDGDGRDELVVQLGPWEAHDVRVLRVQPDGRLALLARERLGGLSRLEVVELPSGERLLAVLKTDRYPNPRLFGPERPTGVPAGLYLYRFDGAGLTLVASHAAADVAIEGLDLLTGDLDGDGTPEVVAHNAEGMVVFDLDAEGRAAKVHRVQGVRALALLQLDDDPADELLVTLDGGRVVWALGVGHTVLPSVALQRRAARGGLERMGLHAAAAQRRSTQAELEQSPVRAAALYTEASDLYAVHGDLDASLAMIQAAAERHASGAVLSRHRDRLAQLGRWSELALLRGADPVETTVIDWAGPLPAMEWVRPTALTHRPGRGLQIRASSGDGVLLRLPLERTADAVALELEAEVTHAEGGAELVVELVGPEGQVIAVAIAPWGGAGLINRKVHCTIAEGDDQLGLSEGLHARIDRVTRHRMRIAHGHDRLVCSLRSDASMRDFTHARGLQLPRTLTLVARMTRPDHAAQLDVELRRVVIEGAHPNRVEEDPGARNVVLGRYTEALRYPLEPLARIELLLGTGDLTGAQTAWRSLDEPTDDASLLPAIRRRSDPWLELLSAEAPERFPALAADAFGIVYGSGRSSERERTLTRTALDRLPVGTAKVDSFLLAHAQQLALDGQHDRAGRILARLTGSERTRTDVRFDAWFIVASLRAAAGDGPGAVDACEQARVLEPIPFRFDDRLAASAELQRACRAP